MKARDVAAYLLDRADQYDNGCCCWLALAEVARNIMAGEVEAAKRNGDFDAALYERVDGSAGAGSAAPRLNAGSMSGRPALESAAAALRDKEASEIMAGGILLRENYLKGAARKAREEADYFKAAYARKLDDEVKALRLADAMAEALQTILLCTHEHETEDTARVALRAAGRVP